MIGETLFSAVLLCLIFFLMQHNLRSSLHGEQSGAACSNPTICQSQWKAVIISHQQNVSWTVEAEETPENCWEKSDCWTYGEIWHSLISQWKTWLVQVSYSRSICSTCHQLHVIMFTAFIFVHCTFFGFPKDHRVGHMLADAMIFQWIIKDEIYCLCTSFCLYIRQLHMSHVYCTCFSITTINDIIKTILLYIITANNKIRLLF